MKVQLIDMRSILIEREDRQRKSLDDIGSLAASIESIGLIQPIVVQKQGKDKFLLIAGERRFAACSKLGWTEIPARLMSDLTPLELKVIELEENVKRKNLNWREKTAAVAELHRLSCEADPTWLPADTAELVAESPTTVLTEIALQAEIDAGNEAIASASTFVTARNTLERQRERKRSTAMSLIKDAVKTGSAKRAVDRGEEPVALKDEPDAPAAANYDIEQADFFEWAASYSGPKFNMLHCDFPYGIGHDKSDMGGAKQHGAYDDTEEVYWALLECLAKHLDKLLLSSAHCIFWYSMNYHQQTIDFFEKNTDFVVFPKPLIWHKTDNKGIVSDASRYPRHVYESALFLSRGDRKLVQSVANVYGAPTQKFHHISEKSEAMLRHFFRMTCDEVTTILDPTCGSGSAIRAAASFNVERALGLELNPEYAAMARQALTRSLGMADLSAKLQAKRKETSE